MIILGMLDSLTSGGGGESAKTAEAANARNARVERMRSRGVIWKSFLKWQGFESSSDLSRQQLRRTSSDGIPDFYHHQSAVIMNERSLGMVCDAIEDRLFDFLET